MTWLCGQLISLLDKAKILDFCRENGGERYIKHFDAWQHLLSFEKPNIQYCIRSEKMLREYLVLKSSLINQTVGENEVQ